MTEIRRLGELIADPTAAAVHWWLQTLGTLIPDCRGWRGMQTVEAPDDGAWPGAPAAAGPVNLRVPAQWLMVREMRYPGAVRENLTAILAADLDRLTPFTPDQVFIRHHLGRHDDGDIIVHLAVLPRRLVTSLISQLERTGNPVLRLSAGPPAPDWLAGQNFLPRCRRPLPALPSRPVLILLLAALSAPSAGLYWQRAGLEADLAAARRDAGETVALARELANRRAGRSALDAERSGYPLVTRLLADLTDSLPANAYLDALTIEGDRVVLSGQGTQAAPLIAALTGGGHFPDAGFAGAVVHDAESGLERFQITAAYRPAKEPTP